MKKVCCICKIEKSAEDFHRNKRNKDGYQYQCKLCRKISSKSYYELNKEKFLERDKIYREKNKQIKSQRGKIYYTKNRDLVIERQRKNYKEYYKKSKKKKQKYARDKRKVDINFKLSFSLRSRLNKAIKNNQKTGSAVRDLGCTIDFLKQWLEWQWKPGMNWDNWSRTGWHIDHIKPLSKFNLTSREELLEACHFTNLQPLWASENLKKLNKYEEKTKRI